VIPHENLHALTYLFLFTKNKLFSRLPPPPRTRTEEDGDDDGDDDDDYDGDDDGADCTGVKRIEPTGLRAAARPLDLYVRVVCVPAVGRKRAHQRRERRLILAFDGAPRDDGAHETRLD
jgi:hypothetical protein